MIILIFIVIIYVINIFKLMFLRIESDFFIWFYLEIYCMVVLIYIILVLIFVIVIKCFDNNVVGDVIIILK